MDYRLPADEAELATLVRAAHDAGEPMKVVGAGHSFSSIAMTDGHMLSLDRMNQIVRQDGNLVTMQAGIRLQAVNSQLEDMGLSLENMGATCEQSIAGATATATHGTGRLTGNIAANIEALRLVVANGTVLEASRDKNPELLRAARVGIGALGVVSEVTIRTLPLFKMRLTNTIMPLEKLLEELPESMERFERLQWFWNPPDEQNATLVTREVVDEDISPGGCWGGEQYSLGETPRAFGQPIPETARAPCVDVSYKAMCGSAAHYEARHLYTEMEMFIPAESAIDAINDFRAFQKEVLPLHDPSISLFTGVRYVAADDSLLSTASGRETAVISWIVMGPDKVQTPETTEFARYGQKLEKLTREKYGGRPHWGKMNWASADTVRPNYDSESWEKFLALRAELDPKGIFLNEYLRTILGVEGSSTATVV
eukprot:TRINITY_DN60710_c0_g1_i1.p1 TRINITY_DN60710_c0_g1~~TRINITY_DN60710_c0_g1_i1.p1  ORF type:complete len:472 (-),score=74.54 TRINITY_DN60710_c0_g1_i1:123-1403(-)